MPMMDAAASDWRNLTAEVLRTISAALVPPIHAFDGLLGLAGRTASQIELPLYSGRQKSVSKTSPCLAEQFVCDDSSI